MSLLRTNNFDGRSRIDGPVHVGRVRACGSDAWLKEEDLGKDIEQLRRVLLYRLQIECQKRECSEQGDEAREQLDFSAPHHDQSTILEMLDTLRALGSDIFTEADRSWFENEIKWLVARGATRERVLHSMLRPRSGSPSSKRSTSQPSMTTWTPR